MKNFIAVVLAIFSIGVAAQETDCSATIEEMAPYKGVVGQLLSVEEGRNTTLFEKTGYLYSVSYIFPSGYVGQTWTVLQEGGLMKPGQKVFWSPANELVRELHPDEDRRVLIVMGDDCRPVQVDISLPASEIVGL